jgi:hypothetical protein
VGPRESSTHVIKMLDYVRVHVRNSAADPSLGYTTLIFSLCSVTMLLAISSREKLSLPGFYFGLSTSFLLICIRFSSLKNLHLIFSTKFN